MQNSVLKKIWSKAIMIFSRSVWNYLTIHHPNEDTSSTSKDCAVHPSPSCTGHNPSSRKKRVITFYHLHWKMSSNKPSQPTDRTSRQLVSSDNSLLALLLKIRSDQSTDALGPLPTRLGSQETTSASRDRTDQSNLALGLLPGRSVPQGTTSASAESTRLLISILVLQRAMDLVDDDLNELSSKEEGSGQ